MNDVKEGVGESIVSRRETIAIYEVSILIFNMIFNLMCTNRIMVGAMHFNVCCTQLFFRVTLALGFTGTYLFFNILSTYDFLPSRKCKKLYYYGHININRVFHVQFKNLSLLTNSFYKILCLTPKDFNIYGHKHRIPIINICAS